MQGEVHEHVVPAFGCGYVMPSAHYFTIRHPVPTYVMPPLLPNGVEELQGCPFSRTLRRNPSIYSEITACTVIKLSDVHELQEELISDNLSHQLWRLPRTQFVCLAPVVPRVGLVMTTSVGLQETRNLCTVRKL
jgi:hypothetical protein